LLGLFNANRVISLTDVVLGWIPDNYKGYANIVSNFFTTIWFAKPFPELVKDHGISKRVDLRCGFSK